MQQKEKCQKSVPSLSASSDLYFKYVLKKKPKQLKNVCH